MLKKAVLDHSIFKNGQLLNIRWSKELKTIMMYEIHRILGTYKKGGIQ